MCDGHSGGGSRGGVGGGGGGGHSHCIPHSQQMTLIFPRVQRYCTVCKCLSKCSQCVERWADGILYG